MQLNLAGLKHLDIRGCACMSDTIVPTLLRLKHSEYLDISYTSITSYAVTSLLPDSLSLKNLTIDGCSYVQRALTPWIPCSYPYAKQRSSLERLSAINSGLTDDNVRYLASVCPRLVTVDLSGC